MRYVNKIDDTGLSSVEGINGRLLCEREAASRVSTEGVVRIRRISDYRRRERVFQVVSPVAVGE
jgi:hypothetical protein